MLTMFKRILGVLAMLIVALLGGIGLAVLQTKIADFCSLIIDKTWG